MLRAGRGLVVDGIVALDAADEGAAEDTGQERVLAPRLHAAAPARIAEDVDVRTPVGEAGVRIGAPVRKRGGVLRASLVRNRLGHLPDQVGIERRRLSDRLGKHGCTPVARHAVQRLVPPPVGRDAKPLNAGRPVHQLTAFLRKRHLRDEFPRLGAESGDFRLRGRLGRERSDERGKDYRKQKSFHRQSPIRRSAGRS